MGKTQFHHLFIIICSLYSLHFRTIDELQPKSLLDAIQNILSILGSLLVAAAVNPYFLLPTVVLGVVFVLMRNAYLKITRNLIRLDGISNVFEFYIILQLNLTKNLMIQTEAKWFFYVIPAKSPAFTHLNATLNGLPTIRAFGKQEILRKEFDDFQDMHSACWFMNIAMISVFGLSLDTLCTIYIACIIFYYMLFDVNAAGDKIGLAISQAINLTGLVPWGNLELIFTKYYRNTCINFSIQFFSRYPTKCWSK